MERKADFGGIIGETVSLLRDGLRGVALYILVVGGLNAVGAGFKLAGPGRQTAGFDFGFRIDPADGPAVAGFQLLAAVVFFVASYFLIAHLLETQGRLPSRETRIWAYAGLGILSLLGLVAGLILLIVPGVILAVRWCAAPGFLIGARLGVVDSLGASWNATKGHSWSIFGALLVVIIGASVIGGLLGGLIGGIWGAMGTTQLIAMIPSFASAAGDAIGAAFATAVFLLVHKDVGELDEVFS